VIAIAETGTIAVIVKAVVVSLEPVASVTATETVYVSAAIGVPEITPVVVSRDNPPPSAPDARANRFGFVPVGEAIVSEYAWPVLAKSPVVGVVIDAAVLTTTVAVPEVVVAFVEFFALVTTTV
jgi:hypothetical protein